MFFFFQVTQRGIFVISEIDFFTLTKYVNKLEKFETEPFFFIVMTLLARFVIRRNCWWFFSWYNFSDSEAVGFAVRLS